MIGQIRLLIVLGILVFVVGCSPESKPVTEAANQSKQDSPNNRFQKRYKEIVDQYDSAYGEWADRYHNALPSNPNQFLEENPSPDPTKYGEELSKLAKANPDNPIAFDALAWTFQHLRGTEIGKEAETILLTNYESSDRLAEIIPWLVVRPTPSAKWEKQILTFMEHGKTPTVKGVAMMALVYYLERIEIFKNGAEEDPELTATFPQEFNDYIASFNSEDYDIESLLQTIVENYAEVKYFQAPCLEPTPLGELAGNRLFAMRNLEVGKAAPEIEGTDLDGVEFKLSDYRGKIVLLDFWGDW